MGKRFGCRTLPCSLISLCIVSFRVRVWVRVVVRGRARLRVRLGARLGAGVGAGVGAVVGAYLVDTSKVAQVFEVCFTRKRSRHRHEQVPGGEEVGVGIRRRVRARARACVGIGVGGKAILPLFVARATRAQQPKSEASFLQVRVVVLEAVAVECK